MGLSPYCKGFIVQVDREANGSNTQLERHLVERILLSLCPQPQVSVGYYFDQGLVEICLY